MNLMPPPGSSPPLVAGAYEMLLARTVGGGIGIASGVAALALGKAGRWHARAGRVFVVTMLVVAIIVAVVSPLLAQNANEVPALMVIYLVATGWRSATDRGGLAGAFEMGALLFVLIVVATGLTFAVEAAVGPMGMLDGQPPSTYLAFTAAPAFAAALDIWLLLRGRLSRLHRTARHVWRVGLALFICAGSLFVGRPEVFPQALRGSPLMLVPGLVILGAVLFWLARVSLSTSLCSTDLDLRLNA